jgi:hypothetical protein
LVKNDMANGAWGFRGVSSEKYDLIPSIGRKDVRVDYDLNLEQLYLLAFAKWQSPLLDPCLQTT